MKTINRMVRQERWRKLPKAKGTVLESSLTKSGNIKLVLKRGEKKERKEKKGNIKENINRNISENITFYVLKRNKNLFEAASRVKEGDAVSVALRSSLGKSYCVRLNEKPDNRREKLGSSRERKLSDWV